MTSQEDESGAARLRRLVNPHVSYELVCKQRPQGLCAQSAEGRQVENLRCRRLLRRRLCSAVGLSSVSLSLPIGL